MNSNIPRRTFLKTAGAGATSILSTLNSWGKEENGKRPNVLLIISDDQAYMDLGCMGNPILKTPNLNRLAEEGMLFTHAFSPNPICTPSRAALLTGQDCWTNGCTFFGVPIKESSTQFAELFTRAGYETFYTGKWHNDGRPSQRGFTAGNYICRGGPGKGGQAKPMVSDFGGGNQRQIDRFSTSLFSDAAVEYLDKRQQEDSPFLMVVSYTSPHDPWMPPGKYAEMYPPEDIPLPPNFMPRPMNGSQPFRWFTDWHGTELRDEGLWPFPRTPEGLREVRSRYYGTITHMDHQIGRILQKLDEKQLSGNTLVIFLADHGISLGAHGFSGKQTMYEEGIRLPFIMRYPKLKRGAKKCSDLITLMDVYPTICQAAKIEVPSDVEGKSVLGLYQGNEEWKRDRIYFTFVSPERHRMDVRAVRTERYKLIHHLMTDEIELYDLQEDPYEMKNLADSEEHGEIRNQLFSSLKEWRERVETE